MSTPPDLLVASDSAVISPAPDVRPLAEAAVIPVSAVKPKERYVYLDAMKGVMILWGIPVHACVISHSAFFHLVSDISNCVRMEAFFMISGFLSYMLVKRYGASTIMRKRVIATGIPLLTVVLLLNPVTNWLILHYQVDKAAALTPELKVVAPTLGEFFTGKIPWQFFDDRAKITWNWHLHIWFLAVLLCLASLSSPIIHALDRTKKALRSLPSRLPDWMILSLAAAAAVFLCVVARLGYEAAIKPFTSPSFHYPLRMVGYYFAFFALGMAMYCSPRLLRIFTNCHWFQLALAGLLLWAARLWQAGFTPGTHSLAKKISEVTALSAEVYVAVAFVPVLFAFFKRFCSGTEGTMRLSPGHGLHLLASGVILAIATRFGHLLPSHAQTWSEIHVGLPAFVAEIGLTPARFSSGLMLAAQGYFFVMVCLVIFGLFERFIKKAGAPMHFVAESAFCVYLFHYLVIYLNALWLRNWVGIDDDFMLSLLVTLFTAGITMGIYVAVERSVILRCLFLGKLPKRQAGK
ncbi:acyltransferase family protein [Luteolibacter luteus]|uniref:Acyltransferase family protein n=1 Tax=Luteolibacter luteus TaxID=2728835 RepID=A0A858RH34_9BACT|nr:acyltransferase family protein [Luteolibacter luteus]QJE95854.1 acyltransferase family protein [Luteolibacter luteus]